MTSEEHLLEQMWPFHAIDAYKPVPEDEDWKPCPNCEVVPRIWQFNNGEHATCWCTELYEESQARAESVLSFMKRNNGSLLNYDGDALRKAWNRYVETGETQNQLPEGQW